jgi:uncharacterized membrane protein YgcG
MKRQILLLAITAVALSSCTTAYRSVQTPDDVYYSPARPQDEYVRVDEEDEYRYDDDYYDDRYLRMKVQNRTRWDYLNDWYYYDRYSYRYNYDYGNYYYNPYTSWNYYYNPYCPRTVVVYNPKQTTSIVSVPKPRNFNLNTYANNNYGNVNTGSGKVRTINAGSYRPVYNNSNSNSAGNFINKLFGGNNSNNNSYSPPSRSYSPSSSGSSGSSGGSSGSSSGGGVTRPSRGGN